LYIYVDRALDNVHIEQPVSSAPGDEDTGFFITVVAMLVAMMLVSNTVSVFLPLRNMQLQLSFVRLFGKHILPAQHVLPSILD
jgi:hypothetical protein